MSDDADRAEEIIEQTVADAIAAARREKRAARATGRCLWCGEKTGQGRRWCSPDCRDDWERAHAAARRR
jgi:hypothetical protein